MQWVLAIFCFPGIHIVEDDIKCHLVKLHEHFHHWKCQRDAAVSAYELLGNRYDDLRQTSLQSPRGHLILTANRVSVSALAGSKRPGSSSHAQEKQLEPHSSSGWLRMRRGLLNADMPTGYARITSALLDSQRHGRAYRR